MKSIPQYIGQFMNIITQFVHPSVMHNRRAMLNMDEYGNNQRYTLSIKKSAFSLFLLFIKWVRTATTKTTRCHCKQKAIGKTGKKTQKNWQKCATLNTDYASFVTSINHSLLWYTIQSLLSSDLWPP